jgi:hypothetical protein
MSGSHTFVVRQHRISAVFQKKRHTFYVQGASGNVERGGPTNGNHVNQGRVAFHTVAENFKGGQVDHGKEARDFGKT